LLRADAVARVEDEHAVRALRLRLGGARGHAYRRLAAARRAHELADLAGAQAALEEDVQRGHTRREQRRLGAPGGEHLPRRAHRLHARARDARSELLELRVIEARVACEELEVAGEQPLDGGRAGAQAPLHASVVTVTERDQRALERALEPHVRLARFSLQTSSASSESRAPAQRALFCM
jgi:hypothetical protein